MGSEMPFDFGQLGDDMIMFLPDEGGPIPPDEGGPVFTDEDGAMSWEDLLNDINPDPSSDTPSNDADASEEDAIAMSEDAAPGDRDDMGDMFRAIFGWPPS